NVGLACDGEHRVHPAYRLEFDDVLTDAAFAAVENLVQFGDDRFRIAVLDREDPDRLALHPVSIEAQNEIDPVSAVAAASLYQDQVAARIGSGHVRLGHEAVDQLENGRSGNVLQRHDRYAVSGFCPLAPLDCAGTDRIPLRGQSIARAVADQGDPAQPQRVFQHVGNV